MIQLDQQQLRDLITRIFEAVGAPPGAAAMVADSLVETSLAGIDSHGIRMIQRYVNSIEAGRLDPKAEPMLCLDDGPLGLTDGRRGFGQLAARLSVDTAIAKARVHGVGIVGSRNGYHIGRVGQYALRGAEQGLVVMGFANASPQVAPYGSSEKIYGTNPFCCAAPRKKGPPILIDAASSLGTVGAVQLARSMGRLIGDGILIDGDGRQTNDPKNLDKGALLPIGAHKGSALSLMVEILAGLVTGRGCAAVSREFAGNGVLFIAIDPSRFREGFEADLDVFCERVSGAKVAKDFERILLPGEPEREQQQKRAVTGIPVDPDTWVFLKTKAAQFEIAVPTMRHRKPMVLFVNQFSPSVRKQYSEALETHCELVFPNRYDLDHIRALAVDAHALVGYRFPRPLLESARAARLIQVTSAGSDGLDLAYIKERGITLANSHANATVVAEHALAMLMSLAKKTAVHDRFMRNGINARALANDAAFSSTMLTGSTIGILGLGHIGCKLARMLTGFDVKVLGYSRSPKPNVDVSSSLEEVLAASDYVVICLPLTPETRGMISLKQLSLMKRDACLINVSRGPIVQEEDLYQALKDGLIRGAALDVWYEKATGTVSDNGDNRWARYVRRARGKAARYSSKLPVLSRLNGTPRDFPSRFAFYKLNNVLLSPHRAALGNTAPYDVIENIRRFSQDGDPVNIVDPDKGY